MSDYNDDSRMEEELDTEEHSLQPQYFKASGATRPPNLPTPVFPARTASHTEKEGMSGVTIALIVGGSLLLCVLVAVGIRYAYKTKR